MLFARLLAKWLDPATSFATAFDPVARSKLSGFLRKKRGVMPGCPDNWVLHSGRLICVELKSPPGRCSRAQRAVREALIRSGAEWWEARSATAAMVALAESGVKFREIVREDRSVEVWATPELEGWAVPRRDPSELRPSASCGAGAGPGGPTSAAGATAGSRASAADGGGAGDATGVCATLAGGCASGPREGGGPRARRRRPTKRHLPDDCAPPAVAPLSDLLATEIPPVPLQASPRDRRSARVGSLRLR